MAGQPFEQMLRHLTALSEDAAARPGPCRTITEAATRGDVALLQAFLDGGEDIEQRSIGFSSPLAAAASRGHQEAVEFLLARGASLEPKDAFFPIAHFPILNEWFEVAERLLQAGAPREPHKPLMLAMAQSRNWHAVDALIAGGLDLNWLNARDRAAFTAWRNKEGPRDDAWLAGRRERAARKRIREQQQMMGSTRALSAAARDQHESAAVALVEQHAELALARLPSGTSVLAQAVTVGARRLAAALIAAGAPLDAADPDNAPLTRAAANGDLEFMTMLLDAGSPAGAAAVVAAARAGSLAGLELLLARGARPQTKERKAALSAACGPNEQALRKRIETLK
jgi:ankyrin repeat protein